MHAYTNRIPDIFVHSVCNSMLHANAREMLQWTLQTRHVPRKCKLFFLLYKVFCSTLFEFEGGVQFLFCFVALSGRNSSIQYLQIDLVIIVTFRIVLIDCNVLKCNSHTNTKLYRYATSRSYQVFFFLLRNAHARTHPRILLLFTSNTNCYYQLCFNEWMNDLTLLSVQYLILSFFSVESRIFSFSFKRKKREEDENCNALLFSLSLFLFERRRK